MDEMIWGRNPILEALRSGRTLNKVLVANGTHGAVERVTTLAREQGVPVQQVDKQLLDKLAEGAKHQGVAAYCSPKEYVELDVILGRAASSGNTPLLLVLAGWEDPHNFGAILRSAEAAGAQGVIIPERRAVPLTGVVSKTSAGAIEHIPVSRVVNLSQTLAALKEAGYWVVGADAEGKINYFEADLTVPLALVIGGEGKGLAHLAKVCDYLVQIPMLGRVGSLNAAVAGSILIYETLRQRMVASRKGN